MSAMEEQVDAKNAMRRQMRARRKALSPDERGRASKTICAKLLSDGGILAAIDPLEGGGAVAVYLAYTHDNLVMKKLNIEIDNNGIMRLDTPKAKPMLVAVDWVDLGAYEEYLVKRLTTVR